jgi:hypothetical protein
LKANARANRRRTARAYGPQRSVFSLRGLFGARLRKLARAKDLRARIAALLALIHNAEAHIAFEARRLAHGFTHRLGGVPRAAFIAEALCFAAFALEAANTS